MGLIYGRAGRHAVVTGARGGVHSTLHRRARGVVTLEGGGLQSRVTGVAAAVAPLLLCTTDQRGCCVAGSRNSHVGGSRVASRGWLSNKQSRTGAKCSA